MADILTPAKVGKAEVNYVQVSKSDSIFSGIDDPLFYCPAGTYTRLIVNGQLYMSDTPMEKRTNVEFVIKATGDVLIAGLGLGLIVHPLAAKPDVTSITIIEKYQDVIDLIAPTLPKNVKINIICADIFEWVPEKGQKWNTIYFDIWPTICTENLDEMKILHNKFKFRVKRDGNHWMSSWVKDLLVNRRRRENNSYWRW